MIVLAENVDRAEQQAGDELTKHIELMSGARLPVIAQGDAPGGHLPIRIGAAADGALEEMIWQEVGVSDGFALIVSGNEVQMRGLMPMSSQHAAFTLLEQLGVRWHDPLEDKHVTSERDTITLNVQRTCTTPNEELRMLLPVTPRSTLYTMRMKHEHMQLVARSPY